jgi:hypothetical protein
VPATYANKACNGGGTWWIDSTAIYTDCVDVAVCIDEVSYIYCPSEANKIAHELARVCFIIKVKLVGYENLPAQFRTKFSVTTLLVSHLARGRGEN